VCVAVHTRARARVPARKVCLFSIIKETGEKQRKGKRKININEYVRYSVDSGALIVGRGWGGGDRRTVLVEVIL